MSKDLQTRQPWVMIPQTMDEAMKFATLISESDLAPKDYKGKPGNVIVAMQMGAEIGLSPMQALQNVAVINGRPSLWGDALLAVCQTHPDFEWINETFDAAGNAVCVVKRKGYPEHTQLFTIKDVVSGGFDKKQGPWQSNRQRMMQLRARAFALRNTFADALKGLSSAEEAMDNVPEQVTVTVVESEKPSKVDALKNKLKESLPAVEVQAEIVDTVAEEMKTEPPVDEKKLKTELYKTLIKEKFTPKDIELEAFPKALVDLTYAEFKEAADRLRKKDVVE